MSHRGSRPAAGSGRGWNRLSTRIAAGAVVAAAVAFAAPAAVQADALTYADGNNVWVSSVDGAVRKQVTTDGQANSYYAFPSLDDAGNVVAIKGAQTTRAIVVLPAGGGTPIHNVMPWKVAGFPNIGPIAARVKPTTGSQLVYSYYLNHGPWSGYPNGGLEHRLAIVAPANPGLPTNPLVDQPGRDNPTWAGDNLVVGSGGQVMYEHQPLQFTSWLADDTAPLVGAEVSRQRHRVLVAYQDGRLGFLAYQGGIPNGQVTNGCFLPVQKADVTPVTWALSPDGNRVAWSDRNGLHLAAAVPQPSAGGGPCPLTDHKILSPTGKQPAFSQAPAPVEPNPEPNPGPGPGPGPGPQPEPGPGPQPNPQPNPNPDPQPTPGPQPAPGTDNPAGPGGQVPDVVAGGGGTGGGGTTQPNNGSGGSNDPANPNDPGRPGAVTVTASTPRTVTAAKLKRGLTFSARVSAPGTLRATVTAAGVRGTLGTVTKRVTKAGTVRLTVTLNRKARRTVARLKGKRLTIRLSHAPRSGKPVTTTRTVKVR